jgi:hypothetical protein
MTTRHQSEAFGRSTETLVFRGILGHDLRFIPMGCFTARLEGPRRTPGAGELFLELLDREGKLLSREPVAATEPVVCAGTSPGGSLVEGRIALPAGGKELRLLKGKALVGSFPIGDAPRLDVRWKGGRLERTKKYSLFLEFSDPAPDAMVKILYQWGEGRYLTAALTRPVGKIEVDFAHLPGGEACRLIITYTSGMRTTAVTTAEFSVPPLEPDLRIVRPRENAVFAPWHPVTLEAERRDRQAEAVDETELEWVLNGKRAGAGALGCLQGLPEGRHVLELRLRGRNDLSVKREFEVQRPKKTAGVSAKEWD